MNVFSKRKLQDQKRLIFLSLKDLRRTPYAELALPCLADDGWDIVLDAPGSGESLLQSVLPYPCRRRDLLPGAMARAGRREGAIARALLRARTGPFDVIYIHSDVLATRAGFWLLGTLCGKRLVYHTYDYYDPLQYSTHSILEGFLARKADCYMNAEFHRAYISRAHQRLRCPILVVPPNLPESWPIPEPCATKRQQMCGGDHPEAFVLMLHGGYSELRMCRELLQAIAMLPKRFRLVMTGSDRFQADFKTLLDQLEIGDRVFRLPALSFNEMLGYTVNADAGVLLYRNSDLGNFFQAPGRLTEYLACGLPLISVNHTGLQNLVRNFDLGECVDATKPQSIAAGILRLADSPERQRLLPQVLRSKFVKHFAFDHWQPRIRDAFDALLRPAVARPGPPHPWIPNDAEDRAF